MKYQPRFSSVSAYAGQWFQNCRFPLCGAVALCVFLTGCSNFGAPEFLLLDSYFPLWMLCAVLGIAAAIIARVIFVRLGLDAILPFRLFIYICLALIVACTLYLLLSTR